MVEQSGISITLVELENRSWYAESTTAGAVSLFPSCKAIPKNSRYPADGIPGYSYKEGQRFTRTDWKYRLHLTQIVKPLTFMLSCHIFGLS